MSFSSKGDTEKTKFAGDTEVLFPSFLRPAIQRSIPAAEQAAGQTPEISPEASGLLEGLFKGDFLAGGPNFNLLMQEAERQILPNVISTFAGAGRGRSGLAGEAAARGLGSAFSGFASAERNRQLGALPFAFKQANLQQAPFNQQLGLLQTLLSSPVGQTSSGFQTSTQTPGRISSLGEIANLVGSFFMMSDRRLKRNIRRIGEFMGFPAYEFSYLWDDVRHVGVMADEVLPRRPDAVKEGPGGFLMVDYGRLAHG